MTPPRPSRFRRTSLWLLALLLSTAGAGAAPAATWRAGTGREKITPPAGLWMTGYAIRQGPAEGTAQELWVKALAFSDPSGNRGVLLTLDLCGITREVSDRVAAELERQHRIPRSAVITNVSHTHCSPMYGGYLHGLRILPPDGAAKAEAYTRNLEQKMIRAGSAALASVRPVAISWGEDAATFGFNRRENADKDVPRLRAEGKLKGPFDSRVPVLAVRRGGEEGEIVALLVSYACHNTTLDFMQWHGDYAGCAQLELERRHPDATVLFAMGCGADANPSPRGTLEIVEQHGRDLADAADRALARPMTRVEGTFRCAFEDIALTFQRKPTEEELREAWEKDQPYKEMYQAWSASVREQLRTKGDDILRYAYPIQAWRLGNLSWAILGGEVVAEYSLRLRKELGADLWVFGYSTDVMAYIPSERVLTLGGYEGKSSMVPYARPSAWSPGLEEKIVARTAELVTRTRERP
ncbi:MAG TPA: neutral/alkaline non-lysosomal ceramidase N-terminal domain-containing protein [Opitutaceae bacterium]|nr:neutral/alkaline non-lysosomal ceramidase N-terminal domain-containing protein [Opitutaceae bacterium]